MDLITWFAWICTAIFCATLGAATVALAKEQSTYSKGSKAAPLPRIVEILGVILWISVSQLCVLESGTETWWVLFVLFMVTGLVGVLIGTMLATEIIARQRSRRIVGFLHSTVRMLP